MHAKQMGITILLLFIGIIVIGFFTISCRKTQGKVPSRSQVRHPEWSKNAVIYEVNIRQYSREGTFNAFSKDIPRLRNLGVDILWLMPVHPIGETDRKGSLGSYYSVKDYKSINKEFGTLDDFKNLVKTAHKCGLKLIIDWVPNHTSKDNELVKIHPEFYKKDSTGNIISPHDWTDVFQLDYNHKATRTYMMETMQWWIRETDLDGFRCDAAHLVPTSFWNEVHPVLEAMKPVFLLAEADMPELHERSFDMSYDWKFHHLMNDIAKGKKNAMAIQQHFDWVDSVYPGNSYLMEFTSNHDENTWNGSEYERLGQGAKAFAVIAATIYGMPLIYNGQESGFARRLNFFDKDSIDWGTYPLTGFYHTLCALKHRNKALWNGEDGGRFQRIKTNRDSSIFAFIREKESQQVLVICNLSSKQNKVTFLTKIPAVNYQEVFSKGMQTFTKDTSIVLAPWQYLVYEK